MSLRPYQQTGIAATRDKLSALPPDRRRLCIVSPTGSGKTVFGAEICRLKTALGKRGLWTAHRVELVDQSAAALEALGLSVGVVAASSARRPNPFASVQVGSIQTLLARGQRPACDYIVIDECHHTASESYREFIAGYPPETQVFGLTATPQRGDGRPLSEYCDILTLAQPSELLAGGWLVPVEIIAPAQALKPGEIAQRPVDAWMAHAAGRACLVFSPSLIEAEKHAEEFRAAGIQASMIEGKTGSTDRQNALKAFKSGALPVIVNVGVLTEGTDLPMCSCVILARGCGTEGLFLQIAGRGLRPWPGKQDCVLIDLRGVSHVHGSPLEDRIYSLDGAGIRRADPDPNPACRVCGAPITPGIACAECGIEPREQRPLIVTGAELVKWDFMRRRGPEERARSLAKWLREGRNKGWKEGAAMHRYRSVFGTWPDGGIKAMARRLLDDGG